MTRVGVITQARTTSERLPGKVLLPAGGQSLLDTHLDRVLATAFPVFVATTTNATDDVIADICNSRDVPTYRGSEPDVLARFHECARAFALDVVVRVTSDCPLVDPRIVADGVAAFLDEDDPNLYLSNTIERTFPRGMDFEVFSTEALAAAFTEATTPMEREHVTPFLYRDNSDRFRLRSVTQPTNRSLYRLTVDTAPDYELIRRLIEDHSAANLSCAEICSVLDEHPKLVEINSMVNQKHLDG